MESIKLFNGYNPNFLLEDGSGNELVPLPILSQDQEQDLLKIDGIEDGLVHYINYSLAMSMKHKFPFFSASNIDGLNFKKVPRKDRWRKDERLGANQFGAELYNAEEARFDRGHMTKREDVQWGISPAVAMNAADSTFYYPNAVPQHKDLNRDIWRSLEDYILNTETKKYSLRICVFTGPILDKGNPYFITPIKGTMIQLPIVFWKVIVYPKSNGQIFRVGFMMSQSKLLKDEQLLEELEVFSEHDDLFMQFDDADTYQVNVSLIEELSGLTFPSAADAYSDNRNTKLVLEEIDIDPDLESFSVDQDLGFAIKNLTL